MKLKLKNKSIILALNFLIPIWIIFYFLILNKSLPLEKLKSSGDLSATIFLTIVTMVFCGID
jgi:hypothetical protein